MEHERRDDAKEMMIGSKYFVSDAIEQLESFVSTLNTMFPDLLQHSKDLQLQPWEYYPALVLDTLLAHSFIYDLIKFETYDFERNHIFFKFGNRSHLNDPMIGYISGYISEYIQACIDRNRHLCTSSVVFIPGRLSSEQLQSLLIQKATSHNSFYESIFIPGLVVCYSDYDIA